MADSACLIGVADTEGILEEGEIFVQIRRDSFRCRNAQDDEQWKKAKIEQLMNDDSHVLTGNLVVTRNPCTHPGDIRIMQGVDRPELRHLYNVVVFSSKGERPACNMMAGGDLDGDVYFVCWDEQLLTHLKPEMIYPPQGYTKPTVLQEKPEGDTLADYFIFYLQKDVLGTISNLHLAVCDYYGRMGPMHPDAIHLSHLASVAVDFAKHGECVSPKEFVELYRILESWPDFMEKKMKPMTPSKGILGELYRMIDYSDVATQFQRQDYKTSVLYDYKLNDKFLALEPDKAKLHGLLVDVFQKIVQPFNRSLRKIMLQFCFASEAEMFTSDLNFRMCGDLNKSASYSSNTGPSKNEEAQRSLRSQLTNLVERYTKVYVNFLESGHSEKTLTAALYLSTYFDQNPSCKQYFIANKKCPHLKAFVNDHYGKIPINTSYMKTLKSSFDAYKHKCNRAVDKGNDQSKLNQLLTHKKLFSAVWLLPSADILLNA